VTALGVSATLVLMPVFDVDRYIQAIKRFQLTWLTAVPAMLAMLLKRPDLLSSIDCSSVEIVRMGSSAFTSKLYDDVRRTFPNATVGNAYGTTEAGSIVFGHRRGQVAPQLSLGWPIDGVEVKILDPLGQESNDGEMFLRTPATMKGYLNLPEKTAEVLSDDGWYRTGDIVHRDASGAFFFVGRADDMFNCGGENVYPGEVERTLELHPAIAQACVVPVPDDVKGFKPFAFVVCKPGQALTPREVKEFALANGPAYQHPRHVQFMDQLPLSGTNKIDRRALSARALELYRSTEGVRNGCSIALDHVGVAMRSLDDAKAIFSRLGFRLTSRSFHAGATRPGGPIEPWASGNHCAVFRRGYLEVAGLTGLPGFSTIAKRIEKYEGAHLIAFVGGRAEDMHRNLSGRGIAAEAPRRLERDATFGPADDETRRARFSNVYVNDQDFPEARFIFIEHLTPEVIWQPHLLDHPNGVLGLSEVTFATGSVLETTHKLGKLLGIEGLPSAAGCTFNLGDTAVHVISAGEWTYQFPEAAPLPLPAPVQIGFQVRSIGETCHFLLSAGIPCRMKEESIWVLPQQAGGVAIRFWEKQ